LLLGLGPSGGLQKVGYYLQPNTPVLFAWAKKARACSSTVSPDSPPIKSKNYFSLRGYCFFVVGDLTDIKAKSTGVVWRDIASFSLLLLLLLLSLSLMTCNVCFL
jgi:hypothetical protein